MRRLLLALCLGLFIPFAPFGQDINQTDEEGKKQGYWIIYGSDYPDKGYPSDGKIAEGNYQDDGKTGEWIKYFNDGKTPRLKVSYKNNKPAGQYIQYYESGAIKETGNFESGKQKDSLVTYYENGSIRMIKRFDEEGKEDGRQEYFFPHNEPGLSGQLQMEYTKEHGITIDTLKRYFPEGYVKEMVVYDEMGKSIISKKFDSGSQSELVNGPKVDPENFEGELKNGEPWNGKHYIYDEKGALIRIEIWKEGKYQKDGQF